MFGRDVVTHKQVYECFEMYFPQFAEDTIAWYPNGKNSIRIRRPDTRDLVFTHAKEDEWCLETVDHFVERLRGRTKM